MANKKPPLVKPKTVPNLNNQKKQPEIKNPILCKAMDVFKADPNNSTQSAFISQLFKSRLLVPCTALTQKPAEGEKKEMKLQFLMLKNKQGENILGAFTDWDQIKKQPNYPKEAAGVPFTEILKIAERGKGEIKGIIINPFEQGIFLDENTVEKMLENLKQAEQKLREAQAAQNTGAAGTSQTEPTKAEVSEEAASKTSLEKPEILYIGEPLEEPYELTKELSRYFKGLKSVQSAYFLEIYYSDHGKPKPFIVIDYKGEIEAKAAVFDEIKKIYEEKTEEPLELTIMTAGEKMAKDAILNKKAFYTRRVFGIF